MRLDGRPALLGLLVNPRREMFWKPAKGALEGY